MKGFSKKFKIERTIKTYSKFGAAIIFFPSQQ
jgi:hypothetical protein